MQEKLAFELRMDFSAKAVIILFFPIIVGAILHGETPATKPPQRQEFLWYKRPQAGVQLSPNSNLNGEGITRAESGSWRGGQTGSLHHSAIQTSPPHVTSSLPFIMLPVKSDPSGDSGKPPTVVPLNTGSLEQRNVFSSTPSENIHTMPEIRNGSGYGRRDSLNERSTSTFVEAPSSECTGRAHSWGCGPFHEDNIGERRLGESFEQERSGLHKSKLNKPVIGQFKSNEDDPFNLYKRDLGQPLRASGGWNAMKDWCLLPNGQYPYPFDCRRFVNCWEGRGYVQPCAPGTLFNSETLECDFPAKVKGCNTWKRDVDKSAYSDKASVFKTEKQQVGSGVASGEFIQEEHYGAGMTDIRVSHRQLTGTGRVGPNVNSHGINAPQTTTTTSTTTTAAPLTSSNKRVGKTSAKTVKNFRLSCQELNGIFPHPHFCDRFVNCHQGRPHSMMCGPGTLFDPVAKQCDHARNVKCSPHEEEDLTSEASSYGPISQKFESGKFNGTPERKKFGETHGLKELRNERGKGLTHVEGPTSALPIEVLPPKPTSNATSPPRLTPHSVQPPRTTPRTVQPPRPTPRVVQPQPKEEFLQGPQPSTPRTGQQIRLRGGAWPWEGYVEVYWTSEGRNEGVWSPVCDDDGKWSLNEASVVCRQLGYHRGAALSWQGKLTKNEEVAAVHVSSVQCSGLEDSLHTCRLGPLNSTTQCNMKRTAAGVRCLREYRSLCGISEIPFAGHCYSFVSGTATQPLISRESAAEQCEKQGSILTTINSQEENDFLSEWLIRKHPEALSVMTGGVSMPMGSGNVWMWEESQFAFTYTNWWSGWKGNAEEISQDTKTRCMVATRKFPCPRDYTRAEELTKGSRQLIQPRWAFSQGGGDSQKSLWCKTDYYFWSAQDCNLLSQGAVCKRNPSDIGCVWKLGMDYIGKANVTSMGNSCIPWNDGPFGSPHPDTRLQGHNFCRNYGGADSGGAAEGHPWCYVDQNGSWESCEIPPCRSSEVERTIAGGEIRHCTNREFECAPGECVANTFVCDGIKDCSNGFDEVDCQGVMKEFRRKGGMKLLLKRGSEKQTHMLEKWIQLSAEECAKQCLKKEESCRSFSYHPKDKQCLLVGDKSAELGTKPQLEKKLGWDHYELLPPTANCRGMFNCKNGSCINSNMVCNGINDCGDRSDEINCTSDAIGFSLRLAGGNASHEGRVEVRAFGHWGVICDDLFGMADADVVCREAGFSLGAAEVVSHSGFGSGVAKGSPLFLIDDVECIGTEESISQCLFPGWGDHNCGPEEVAGVVCKIPGTICQDDQFHCQKSKECIPIDYLCDNVPDCEDGSDEAQDRCQSEVLVRLAGGPSNLEGRVEVRYRGVWGTICDDDFGVPDAQVICRTLGHGWGSGVLALKDAHYGPGKGPIWLDELHCSGQEEKLLDCPRFPWGKNNCGHKEDASVRCTAPGDVGFTRKSNTPIYSWVEKPPGKSGQYSWSAKDILPSGCGIQSNISAWLDAFNIKERANTAQARVMGGSEFKLGPIPWQASLRIRSHAGKSVHWCGAVVLSPLLVITAGHCLQDYAKEAYIVRVGDYDTALDEGTEQELSIEEVYLHEEFNLGTYLSHDIAVIKLKGNGIRFGHHVHAACLPSQEEESRKGDWNNVAGDCVISGWGSIGGTGAGYSRTLRSAIVPLLAPSVCRAPHVYGKEAIGKGMGCAGSLSEGGSDSCQGDSGGPLICFEEGGKPILYGITSWGQGCGRANKPGVYSRVAFYRNWIDKKLQEAMSGM